LDIPHGSNLPRSHLVGKKFIEDLCCINSLKGGYWQSCGIGYYLFLGINGTQVTGVLNPKV
tara:strand:- start:6 stop:188 length:183 start_codon:yes stop_codon:yes gene_type:complete